MNAPATIESQIIDIIRKECPGAVNVRCFRDSDYHKIQVDGKVFSSLSGWEDALNAAIALWHGMKPALQ